MGNSEATPRAAARLEEFHLGISDAWPYHLKCTSCGTTFGYFDCYTNTGESRVLKMRYCMRCGAKIKD